jgi:heme exporter protein C
MLSYFANPERFQNLAKWLAPPLMVFGLLGIAIGFGAGLFVVPVDYQQGEAVRMMYVHVPAAWLSSFAYAFMAVASLISFVWRHNLADAAAKAAAPLGAAFTFLALLTGALWGKPMWGAYWVWDARLTSMLVMFFLYLGYMAVRTIVPDEARAARLAAITAMVGAINLPIIKFSVDWWSSLHQSASVFRAGGSTIDSSMLWPLLVGALGYTALFGWLVLVQMQTELDVRHAARLQRRMAGGRVSRPQAPQRSLDDA